MALIVEIRECFHIHNIHYNMRTSDRSTPEKQLKPKKKEEKKKTLHSCTSSDSFQQNNSINHILMSSGVLVFCYHPCSTRFTIGFNKSSVVSQRMEKRFLFHTRNMCTTHTLGNGLTHQGMVELFGAFSPVQVAIPPSGKFMFLNSSGRNSKKIRQFFFSSSFSSLDTLRFILVMEETPYLTQSGKKSHSIKLNFHMKNFHPGFLSFSSFLFFSFSFLPSCIGCWLLPLLSAC